MNLHLLNRKRVHIISMNKAIGKLHLWRSISPALPIGAYAYSQGLEFACDQGWVHNTDSAHDWIAGIMSHTMAKLDIPLLVRLIGAWQRQDQSQIYYWNQLLLASRESQELRNEDEHLGSAFTRIIKEENIQLWDLWQQTEKPCYATVYALFIAHWQIELVEACCGYIWSWCQNQVGAATSLGSDRVREVQTVAVRIGARTRAFEEDAGVEHRLPAHVVRAC